MNWNGKIHLLAVIFGFVEHLMNEDSVYDSLPESGAPEKLEYDTLTFPCQPVCTKPHIQLEKLFHAIE